MVSREREREREREEKMQRMLTNAIVYFLAFVPLNVFHRFGISKAARFDLLRRAKRRILDRNPMINREPLITIKMLTLS